MEEEHFIGDNEYDFEALDNLPPGYLNQINNMLSNAKKEIRMSDVWLDTYIFKLIDNKTNKIIMESEGSPDKSSRLYYDPRHFMFNYIPLSLSQKRYFIKNLFIDHFSDYIIQYLYKYEGLEHDVKQHYKEHFVRIREHNYE